MCVVACHSALLLVDALPVTVWQPLTRAAGQWTHPRVQMQGKINFIGVYIHSNL